MANGLFDFLGGLGTTPPSYMEGLLGAQATEDLRKRSIGSGLVNALIGYAAAPKNQNLGLGRILASAAQQGLAGARGVYDTATQDAVTQQKLAEMQRAQKQQAAQDLFRSKIGKPNATRNIVTQNSMQVPAAQGLDSPNFATQSQEPTVTQEQYYDPKVMLQEALQSGALPVPAYFELMAKEKTDSPFGKVDASKFTKDSILKFTTTGRYEDLDAIEGDKGFGAGTAGASLNLLTKGSLNSPNSKAIRSSPDYALAYREVTKPQTIQSEEMDEQGNMRFVTRQVPAPALPKNILPPIFTQQSADAIDEANPSPSFGTKNISSTSSSGSVQNATPSDSTQPLVPSGTKSSPFTRTATELGKYREKIDQAAQLKETLLDLKQFAKDNPNTSLWGVGDTGAVLQSKYEDALTQLRIAAELGVLNKEDLPRLMASLPNPTELKTWVKGGGTLKGFNAALTSQTQKIDRDIERWGKYVNPNARQNSKNEKPASPLPKIGDKKNGYTFMGGNPNDSKSWEKD